jgi:hypothetical protein
MAVRVLLGLEPVRWRWNCHLYFAPLRCVHAMMCSRLVSTTHRSRPCSSSRSSSSHGSPRRRCARPCLQAKGQCLRRHALRPSCMAFNRNRPSSGTLLLRPRDPLGPMFIFWLNRCLPFLARMPFARYQCLGARLFLQRCSCVIPLCSQWGRREPDRRF